MKKYLFLSYFLFFCFFYSIPSHALKKAPASNGTIKFTFQRVMGRVVYDEYLKKYPTPPEGFRLIRSRTDKKFGYYVKEVEIKSEGQLLQLLGTKSFFAPGKKALYDAYVAGAKSPIIQGYLQKFPEKNIDVTLVDADNFRNDDMGERDFWPRASGSKITIGSAYFSWGGSGKSTMTHEFAHTLDDTVRESGSYGPDGIHYANEIITRKAAWVEGWANYNECLISKWHARKLRAEILLIKEEKKQAGKYERHIIKTELNGQDYLELEAVNALILHEISKNCKDGVEKVLQIFRKTNNRDRDLDEFLGAFAKQYPADIPILAAILDKETNSKLTGEEIIGILGEGATDYVNRFKVGEPRLEPPSGFFDFVGWGKYLVALTKRAIYRNKVKKDRNSYIQGLSASSPPYKEAIAVSGEVESIAARENSLQKTSTAATDGQPVSGSGNLKALHDTYIKAKQQYQISVAQGRDAKLLKELLAKVKEARDRYFNARGDF
ncbi:hypothetical protein ACFL35_17970 [Candidatus Riflebacteria bacterium]